MILTDEEVWSLWNSQATDDMNMQEAATFARIVESAVLRKLRERPADAWLIDWPDEPELGHYLAEGKSDTGRNRSLHIIPTEVNE